MTKFVCGAQNIYIHYLCNYIIQFYKGNDSTRVMSVSIPTGWGKTRIAVQSLLRATKKKSLSIILYPQRREHIDEIWQRENDWKQKINSNFCFIPKWQPIDEDGNGKSFIFKRKYFDDFEKDESVKDEKSIKCHLNKRFFSVLARKQSKKQNKKKKSVLKKMEEAYKKNILKCKDIFVIIDEWHSRDYLKKFEDYCKEYCREKGYPQNLDFPEKSVVAEQFWRKEILKGYGKKKKIKIFILLLSATPIASTNRMDSLYEKSDEKKINLQNSSDINAFKLLTDVGNQDREENPYKMYMVYPGILEIKSDFLAEKRDREKETECVCTMQRKNLSLWQKDYLEILNDIEFSKPKKQSLGVAIYRREQSEIIKKGKMKFKCFIKFLKKHEKQKFLIFCIYREDVAEKLRERMIEEFGDDAVAYLNLDKRDPSLEEFNKEGSSLMYLIATDCDSQGIDLQKSGAWLIHYELPWNPIRVIQRFGRVWRLSKPGTDKEEEELTCPVAFYLPSTYSSEEEKINRLKRRWNVLKKQLPKKTCKCLPPVDFDIALGIRLTPNPSKE